MLSPVQRFYEYEENLCPDDFCSEEEALELLKSIGTTKANGPDGISGTKLKVTAYAITLSVTALFYKSICIALNSPDQMWGGKCIPIIISYVLHQIVLTKGGECNPDSYII